MESGIAHPIEHSLRKASRLLGQITLFVGVAVSTGWVFDVSFLKSVVPGLATMKANAAVCFLLAGLSLWLQQAGHASPAIKRLRQGLALAVGLVGLLTCSEFLAGRDFGIDQFVFKDSQSATASPGRMSAAAAFSFLALGAALFALDRRRGVWTAQLLAFGVVMISLIALVGYLYRPEALYAIGPFDSLALHSAITFHLLALGVLIARPDGGALPVILGAGAGGRMARRLLPAVLIIPVLLGWLKVAGQRGDLINADFSLVIRVIAGALALGAFIWWAARSADEQDRKRSRTSQVLQEIITGTSGATGKEFFAALTQSLSVALDVRYVLVTEMAGLNPPRLRTLAVCGDQILEKNFEYDLAGTPCEVVLAKSDLTYFPKGVAGMFPQDRALAAMRAESYMGLPLRNSALQVVGHLCIVDVKPLENASFAESILTIFGARAAAEIERKQSEKALLQSQEMFSGLFEFSPDGLIVTDSNGAIRQVNSQIQKLFGYSKEELTGQRIEILVPERLKEQHKPQHDQYMSAPVMRPMGAGLGLLGRRKDASEFPVDISLSPITTPEGVFALCVVRDVTQRKAATEALRESEARYRNLIEASVQGVVVHQDSIIRYANPAAVRMFGYEAPEDLVGKRFFETLVKPEMQPEIEGRAQAVLRGERLTIHPGWQGVRKDKALIWIESGASRILWQCQPAVLSVFLDVTKRRRAEEALRASEELHNSLLSCLPQQIFRKDAAGRFTFANDRFCQTLGCSLEGVLGKTDFDFYPRGLAEMFRRDDARVMEMGETLDSVEEHQTPDGRKLFVHVVKIPVFDERRKVAGVQAIFWDVTAEKVAQDKIREMASLLDLAQDAILIKDLDDRIVYWNKGAARLYGWEASEAQGQKSTELFWKDGQEASAAARKILVEKGEWMDECRHVSKAGKEVLVISSWTLLRDPEGNPKSIFSINTDITEKKKLERQFLRSQRLESIGVLAGGIAHDLNNILAPITMSVDMLRGKPRDASEEQLLSIIDVSAQRGAGVVRQVLTFARGIEGERVLVQPKHLIKDLLKMARETFPRNIQITAHVPNDLWPVTGDATQLHQVLLNLCVNARDAMPEGGRLVLSAENVDMDEAMACATPGAKAGPYVILQVEDSGSGIPPEIMDRIFDPFFTTKEVGQGTGLGLSTVLGIVRGHGGLVSVYSQPGQGAKFRVCLPATIHPIAEGAAKQREAELPRGHGELILLVDDEASIRDVVSMLLINHGYQVLKASDGVEAITVFAQNLGKVRLVLTDIMMPNMDGPALVRSVKKIDAGIRIIASSGFGESSKTDELKTLGIHAFLSKPYNIRKLLAEIQNALAESSPPAV